MLFQLGQVVMTRSVEEQIDIEVISNALARHASGDWGTVDEEDKKSNDEARIIGERILSVYPSIHGKFWIITEWDRSVTTVLFPEEY